MLSTPSLAHAFTALKDPRRLHLQRHPFRSIVLLSVCAVLAGANDWQQIVVFGNARRAWLERFLDLPNGIPSHDTLERVFDHLKPSAFSACFARWTQALADTAGLSHIAIDGKSLRGSADKKNGLGMLHVVSAWATEHDLSLGQVAVDAKSNEITAIPELLELLDLQGVFVTIDAMGCQKEIAQTIVAGGGDYVLTVKENQPNLLEDIQTTIGKVLEDGTSGIDFNIHSTREVGHGRTETRTYTVVSNLDGIRHREDWSGLSVIGMCVSERQIGEKFSEEVRYFIGSGEGTVQDYAKVLRNHWGIENNLHWQLDVTFREDGSRIGKRHGAENFSLLRRLALMLLKRHPSKLSLPCKRLKAALDTDFLKEILTPTGILGNQ